ncbi:MAG: diguanylate cyclase [Calditerrivibrio sp.]|nr:diguanylate cyclase [Calditerrivibrio sp.]MCA1932143.1 diguanylate cyclase [Calditerrivibrio sp.]MCA1980796.1 diguanylate cyclase [Calditerrivibrio sp.]
MNVKFIANSIGEIVMEGLKNIRSKRVPLTATTLANYLKDDEDFNKIFSNIGDPQSMNELRFFVLDKILFFQSIIPNQELNSLKSEIEKDEHNLNLKGHIISLISIIAEYLDKAINIQSRLKNIIDEIVLRFDKTSSKLTNILDENSKVLKHDIEEDKLLIDQLGDVNSKVINESSLEKLKQVVLSKIDDLSKEINKKIDNKTVVLDHLEKEKEVVNKELTEYRTKEAELERLKKDVERYKMESVTDPLTSLFNRKFMAKKIMEEIERCKRYGSTFSLIFLDIDDFKKINDVYGHIIGDFVLKYLSDIIKSELRKADYAFRYGGEEMVILLAETGIENAIKFSERLLETIRNTVFKYKSESLKITVSMGVSEFNPAETMENLINRADMAMLRAKREGKNRIVSG